MTAVKVQSDMFVYISFWGAHEPPKAYALTQDNTVHVFDLQ